MEKARRPQVPAFGEWNYCYHHYGEPPAASGCYYAPEPETCGDVWFRYSPPPPPRKPTPKKTRRPEGEKGSGQRERASEGGGGLARGTAVKARGASASRVVRPVDEDLYQVPQPEFVSSRRPRRKRRSLLMGCFGGRNSCVA